MTPQKHKIPLLLKIVRAKYAKPIIWLDKVFRKIKKNRKFNGTIKKLLFIRIDRIGDAVVTLPLLRDLKLNYPNTEIHLLASQKNSFVFTNISYIDKLIIYNKEISYKYIKSFSRFFFWKHIFVIFNELIIPFIFKKKDSIVTLLKKEKYDCVVDLTGDKRSLILSRLTSGFAAGSKISFFLSYLYNYQYESNWVDINNKDFMIRKYENCLDDALSLKINKRDNNLPLIKFFAENCSIEYDIIFHIHGGSIRSLDENSELKLLTLLSSKKVLITDAEESLRYKFYRDYFKENNNIYFKIYDSLEGIRKDVIKCRLYLCYDGGQAHYLSQYIKSIVIFSAGSPQLWKPYEFEDYGVTKTFDNGVIWAKSRGVYGHSIIYFPIWCNPCFDIGCKSKPCIKQITSEQIFEIVNSEL